MKVIFHKKNLMKILEPAAGIPLVKNTYLPCGGLLFECPPDKRFGECASDDPDLCRISAFDLDTGLRGVLPCTVREKGMCIIPMQTILQIVRSLPDGEITLETFPSGNAVISAGKINFRTSVSPGENFPSMPMLTGSKNYNISQKFLRSVLSETVFAVAQTDTAHMGFHGALFRIRDKELTVAGCDNYRLAVSCGEISVNGEPEEELRLIIPGKFLRELLHLLNDTEETITMTLGRKHIIFELGELCFFTRILEIEYPDYEKMLPVSYTTQVSLSRAEFTEAIERASIIAEAKLGGIGGTYVKLDFSDNTVHVSSVASSAAVDEILSADMTGADLTIGFECRNLLETLKAIPRECERIRLRMNSPIMGITIESAQDTSFSDSSVYTIEDFPEKNKTPPSGEKKRFMYFVLPTRMNISVK